MAAVSRMERRKKRRIVFNENTPEVNGAKLRGIWGILLPRRGYRIQPWGSTLGNFNLAVRPHKALPRSALLEKHPVRRVGGAEGA